MRRLRQSGTPDCWREDASCVNKPWCGRRGQSAISLAKATTSDTETRKEVARDTRSWLRERR